MKMNKNHTIKYLALLLVAALFLGFGALPKPAVLADETEASETVANSIKSNGNYALMASNSNLALYVEGATGHFAVVDKKANSVWYSIPQDTKEDKISKGTAATDNRSELLLEYMAVQDVNTANEKQKTNSQIGCIAGGAVTVESIDNGVTVLYEFDEEEIDIKIPVRYVLHDDYLETSIDTKNIDEGKKNYIVAIGFLSTFGAVGPNAQGYLFVPDGCGAVAGFNRGIIPYQTYNEMVYGYDRAMVYDKEITTEEYIRFPVFGTVVEGSGAMMGVITKGAGAGAITAKTGSANVYYNAISSQLAYRNYSETNSLYNVSHNGGTRIFTLTDTPYGLDEYTLRYYFLSGEDASYIGMANTYRNYLINEKGLKQNPAAPSLALNIYGAIETPANILGVNYNKKRLLTSFDEAKSILEELKANGVDNITVQYIGWNNDGVYNRSYPDSAKPLSILGGKSGFESLVDYFKKSNTSFYFTTDLIEFSKGSLFGASAKGDAIKAPNGEVARQYQYSISMFEKRKDADTWVYVRPNSLKELSEDFIEDFKERGLKSIGLANIGRMVYSDFDRDDGSYRSVNVNKFEEFISQLGIDDIAIDGGNAYALPYVSTVFEAPMTSSNYDIFDYDVPFYHIVLHGYVNYTTPTAVQTIDIKSTFLKSLETGSDMLFSCVGNDAYNTSETRMSKLYSSQYYLWRDEAVQYYKEYSAINSKLYDKQITGHDQLADGVFKTTYSNGTAVYVNYNKEEVTVGETVIGAQGYVVKEAE